MYKRHALKTVPALAIAGGVVSTASAQNKLVKFQFDQRLVGLAALFLSPACRGYVRDAGLDISIDAGSGSAGTVTHPTTGTYDMGLADMAAMMRFHVNNTDVPNKPVAIKRSSIRTPKDLGGAELGTPALDAGRKAWSIFEKINGVGPVN